MKNSTELKRQLYKFCVDFIEERLAVVKNTIEEIRESLQSETKSSAGDKHETGRAMLQLEREKAGNQLVEIQKIKTLLSRIDTTRSSEVVGLGSLVFTSKANYYLAISAGEFTIDGKKFYAISPQAPIGNLLLGKVKADEISFRETKFTIVKVL